MGPGTAVPHDSNSTAGSIAAALLPLMAVVVVAYLVTGIAMPVLPVYVHQGIGLGTFVVGLVAGTQFVATLNSHLWAGRYVSSNSRHTRCPANALCRLTTLRRVRVL